MAGSRSAHRRNAGDRLRSASRSRNSRRSRADELELGAGEIGRRPARPTAAAPRSATHAASSSRLAEQQLVAGDAARLARRCRARWRRCPADRDRSAALLAGRRERGRQIDRRGGLADPALLVGDRDDAGAARRQHGAARVEPGDRLTRDPRQIAGRRRSGRTGSASTRHRPLSRLAAPRSIPAPACSPFEEQADACPGAIKRSASVESWSSGAQARAVTTSTAASRQPSRSAQCGCITGAPVTPRRLAQEGAFAAIGSRSARHPARPSDRQHQARESRRRCRDRPGCAPGRQHATQLRRIQQMPAPQIAERIAADQIDPRRPAPQQRGIGFSRGQCFT